MKTAFLALLLAASVLGDESNVSSIANGSISSNIDLTVDGIIYTNVTFGRVTPSSVSVVHSTGIAAIPMEKLPPDLRKRFGYEPAKATEFRAAERAAEFQRIEAERVRKEMMVKQMEVPTTAPDGSAGQSSSQIQRVALVAPQQIVPANGSVFDHYPRQTTLQWAAVSGATSYSVEIDCFGCCGPGFWCTDVGKTYRVVTRLTGTSYTFDFVGAQPGRWRVWAIGPNGTISPKSGWWGFDYTQ